MRNNVRHAPLFVIRKIRLVPVPSTPQLSILFFISSFLDITVRVYVFAHDFTLYANHRAPTTTAGTFPALEIEAPLRRNLIARFYNCSDLFATPFITLVAARRYPENCIRRSNYNTAKELARFHLNITVSRPRHPLRFAVE